MNHMRTEECHSVVGKKFPPLFGRERRKFLRTGTTVLVVRDPFERLVSAYLDKLAKFNPDPSIQPKRRRIALYIKNKFRAQEREGIVPTFEEFVKYVIHTWRRAAMDEERMMVLVNMHWKPIYVNCGPCSQRYDLIMKMETLTRDFQYIKQKLNLDIKTDYIHHQGIHGNSGKNSQTAKYYSALDKDLKLELLKMYRYDFELFGYDWKKYF